MLIVVENVTSPRCEVVKISNNQTPIYKACKSECNLYISTCQTLTYLKKNLHYIYAIPLQKMIYENYFQLLSSQTEFCY